MKRSMITGLILAMAPFALSMSAVAQGHHGSHGAGNKKEAAGATLVVPSSIHIEHQELHKDLAAALELGGRTSEAANVVAERLHQHFTKEEEVPMPLLGTLGPLSRGEKIPDAKEARELSKRLKAMLPEMLAEHKAIVQALDALRDAATAENHPDVVQFTERLKVHATNEEQVLYPAAMLVADLL